LQNKEPHVDEKLEQYLGLFNPRIERLEKDLDNLHNRARDFEKSIQSISLLDADFNRRIDILEKIYVELRLQHNTFLTDAEIMRASVQDLREKMITIVEGLNTLAKKFDQQHLDINNIALTATVNHTKRVRLLVGISGAVTAIVLILNQIFYALTGSNILGAILKPIHFLITGS